MSRYQELISTGIILTIVTGGIAGAVTGFALNEIVANRAVLAVAAALNPAAHRSIRGWVVSVSRHRRHRVR